MELLLIVVALIVQLALDDEYDCWAPRLSAVMIRAASLLLPRSLGHRYREEWLAELDQASGPLLFALLDVLPAAAMLGAQRRVRRAHELGCALLSRLRHALAHGVGAGLGGLLGGLLGHWWRLVLPSPGWISSEAPCSADCSARRWSLG